MTTTIWSIARTCITTTINIITGLFTAFAILAWDFARFIFATQVIIVVCMFHCRLIKGRVWFIQNFIFSHIMARIFTSMIRLGWVEFHQRSMSFDCTLLITLVLYIIQKYPTRKQRQRKIEMFLLRLFLLVMAITSFAELFSNETFITHYAAVLLAKLYMRTPEFSTMLHLCESDYATIDSNIISVYNCLFLSKFLAVLVIIWSANWLHKRRQTSVERETNRIQRAKNYLLEDYLEEKKMSMTDLANIEQNTEIQRCFELLKNVQYDYDRYKSERLKLMSKKDKNRPQTERDAFLSEVKKFKNEISEKDGVKHNELETKVHDDTTSAASNHINASQSNLSDNENAVDTKSNGSIDVTNEWRQLFVIERPHYFYNLVQTIVLAILTVLMMKVKFILTPCLCLVAASFPLRRWFPKSYSLWTIYLVVIGICVLDRGVHNIRQQYQLESSNNTAQQLENENLYEMLTWIRANTDRSAIFAGPEEIITTVLLTTGRPIANNPFNSHSEMRFERKLENLVS